MAAWSKLSVNSAAMRERDKNAVHSFGWNSQTGEYMDCEACDSDEDFMSELESERRVERIWIKGGSSAIRRCISVFGLRVDPATGLAVRMDVQQVPIGRMLVGEEHLLSLRGNERLCWWPPEPAGGSSARTQFARAPRPRAAAFCSPQQPATHLTNSLPNPLTWLQGFASDHGAIGSFGGCHERGKGRRHPCR